MTPCRRPVLIVNPTSGGGKATRFDLVSQCRTRGIEPVVFQPGDDLTELAASAVRGGADALGMAGGDGSQAAVAAVAAAHDLPYVCIAAGTRNHFAFDIGVDRDDVVGGLDAFVDGVERRIDLGRVNGRVFVNNVAMGLYGSVVDSAEYRDHKLRTVIRKLPELIGPAARPFDLRYLEADGREQRGAYVLLVSNNPYRARPSRHGTRGTLDAGVLGVVAVTGPPPHRLKEWTTSALGVDSTATVALGIDGESAHTDPPLHIESLPRALRLRTPPVRRSREVRPS